jgi:hypothetical protein
LFLSPHPDDLVFSCFSAIKPEFTNVAIIFFNSSTFTRWPIHSKTLVSAYRTLEDRLVLGVLGVKPRYLFLSDTSIINPIGRIPGIEWDLKIDVPSGIYCPLGVGYNRNHIQVREWAIRHWLEWQKNCDLFFYEDLPYAAKLESSRAEEEVSILKELESRCGKIEPLLKPLSAEMLSRKLLLSRLYFSQTDYTSLLESFAKFRGKSTQTGLAEAVYKVVYYGSLPA